MILQTIASTFAEDEDLIGFQSIEEASMTTVQSLTELAIRFFLNLLVCWTIVRVFYYSRSRRRDYCFTFLVFSSAMVLLLYMMGNVEVGVGLTLGLFAIFGVIRYRTETVPVREMTYLFVIIAIAAVNGLAPVYTPVGQLSDNPHYALDWGGLCVAAATNLLMLLLIFVLERIGILPHTSSKTIIYDRIALITPERREELTADIESRTGLKVDKVHIGQIDFLKDSAELTIYYHE